MTNQFLKIIVLTLSATVLTACSPFDQTANTQPSSSSQNESLSPAVEETQVSQPQTFEFVAQETDQNALQATQARTTVEMKQYDFGAMVESISGQATDNDHYWALYVNDEYAQTGADQIQVKPGDRIKWVFEEIQQGL